MKRSTQLKRTGFKPSVSRPVHVRTRLVTLVVGDGAPRGTYMRSVDEPMPQPKHDYVRSDALLAAVRKLPCQLTGLVGMTEPAHSNWQMGKGMGVKADDNRVAAICHALHADIDQGSRLSIEDRQALWWQAHVRTVRVLLARGEWPSGVPVPDTLHNPFVIGEPAATAGD